MDRAPPELHSLLDIFTEPALVIARDRRILMANAAACDFLGAPDPQALVGTLCHETLHKRKACPPACPLDAARPGAPPSTADMPVEAVSKRARVSCTPLSEAWIPGGAVLHVITDLSALEQTQRRLDRQEAQQNALADLGRAALSAGSFPELAQRCAERAAELLEGDLSVVLALPPGRSPLRVEALAGPLAPRAAGDAWPLTEQSFLWTSRNSPEPVDTADLEATTTYAPDPRLRELGLRAAVAAPVLSLPGIGTSRGRVGHLLCLFCKRQRRFRPNEVQFLQVAAALLAQRARLDIELESVRQSEARLRGITDQTFDLISIASLDWRILYVNATHETLLGYRAEDLLSTSILSYLHPEDAARAAAELSDAMATPDPNRAHNVRVRFRAADGTYRTLDTVGRLLQDPRGRPSEMLLSSRDITRRVALEKELRETRERLHQSQRLEALGQFAGTVAHDFNNLITVMQGTAALLSDHLRDLPEARQDLEELKQAARSAARLNQQLLAFARQQPAEPTTFCLAEAVRESRPMLVRLCGEDISIMLHLPPQPCPVHLDRGQVDQILMNLASNARDALPSGGRIDLGVRCRRVHGERCPTCGDIVEGEIVSLTFQDNGCGMDAETAQRALEPFFTSKEAGRGTGLGLASVHGIVKQHGGHVHLRSAPGRGTAVSIWLPLAPEASPRPSGRRDSSAMTILAPQPGTILVVEDDALLRRLAARCLREVGHTVLEAGTPDEAVRVAEQHGAPLDLLVADVVLPGDSGPILHHRLQERFSGLAALYLSGYDHVHLAERYGLPDGADVLAKPFRPAELAARVSQALSRARAAGSDPPAAR